MEQLTRWFDQLASYLGTLGVPEAYRGTVALAIPFVLLTLLVVVLIVVILRRSSRAPGAAQPAVEAPAVEPAEPVAAPEETAAEGETEVAPSAPPPAAGEARTEAKAETEAEPPSLFERMRRGLAKTQTSLVGRVDALLSGRSRVDADLLEELEEILITADLGMKTTRALIDTLEQRLAKDAARRPELVRQVLQEEMAAMLGQGQVPLDMSVGKPFVIMVVGVNGVGKTTTIGKLAKQFCDQGLKVVLGAGDTFRAAAADQLSIWGDRSGAEVVRGAEGGDPASVAFDAAKAALARRADVLILDTAGRLHTKVNLMEELKKVRRVIDREIPGAPHETLLVLDATTGQNALAQARLFGEAVAVSGIALTKLDGTARGGIVVAIAADLGLPVRFVGVGEKAEDLRPFDPQLFVRALFETGEKS